MVQALARAILLSVILAATSVVGEEPSKNRPVSKVIVLLKDMLQQLTSEAKEDEEIYDQMACWCETNDRAKTKAISDAEARIATATSQVEELSANSARLSTEIANLEVEVAKFQKALDEATALRQKQLAEFNAEEKESIESISALNAAIVVLSKHHSQAFVQLPHAALRSVASTLQRQMQMHPDLLEGVITATEMKQMTSFIQASGDFFDATPTFKQSYAPQSSEIFGILKQMKETFDSNLASSQKEEAANAEEYNQLKTAQENQISAASDQIASKKQSLADTDESLALTKQDIEDTQASLSADEQFLLKLKERCAMTDQEWDQRQKDRQLEMEAVSKALAILATDEAHDTFTSTFNPALLQVGQSKVDVQRRTQASMLLSATAQRWGAPHLATLAVRVRLDAFTKVKAAIDDMVVQLSKETQDEIKQRDFCIESLNQNQLETQQKTHEKEGLLSEMSKLEATISELTDGIQLLRTEIEDLQVQLKHAGEDREKQNKDFQATISDQRQTQALLVQALTVLKSFYQPNAFIQRGEPTGPAPPPGFRDFAKNSNAVGVVGLIEQIIEDTKGMEADVTRDEEDAQKAYEDFVQESNRSVDAKSSEVAHKSKEKAEKEANLVAAKADLDNAEASLESLANGALDLQRSCNFVLKNFEVRQAARDEEIEALKKAKAILSGALFEESQ